MEAIRPLEEKDTEEINCVEKDADVATKIVESWPKWKRDIAEKVFTRFK